MGSTILGSQWGALAGFVEQTIEPVTFPVTVTPGTESIELDWDAVEGAQFYRVWCGLTSDKMAQVSEDLMTPGYTINNLLGNQQYFCQVTAIMSPRESIASVSDDGSGTNVATQTLGIIPQASAPVTVGFDDGTNPATCGFNNSGPPPITVSSTVAISAAPSGVSASVDWATQDGPAVPGCFGGLTAAQQNVDYTPGSGTLTWNSGDGDPQTINVDVLEGATLKSVLSIVLSNPVNCTITKDTTYIEIQSV